MEVAFIMLALAGLALATVLAVRDEHRARAEAARVYQSMASYRKRLKINPNIK